jgi:hypothetical protein
MLRKPFIRVTELHDQGVTEVISFVSSKYAMASTTTILELAEEHRKVFQKWNLRLYLFL